MMRGWLKYAHAALRIFISHRHPIHSEMAHDDGAQIRQYLDRVVHHLG
jgi:hypothetical protein